MNTHPHIITAPWARQGRASLRIRSGITLNRIAVEGKSKTIQIPPLEAGEGSDNGR